MHPRNLAVTAATSTLYFPPPRRGGNTTEFPWRMLPKVCASHTSADQTYSGVLSQNNNTLQLSAHFAEFARVEGISETLPKGCQLWN
jgi:hypothetical protein